MPDPNQVSNGAENAQNAPITLTAEQAEILLRADLRNLAKKVQQGRPLSAAERNLLQSTLNGGRASVENFAANQVELAHSACTARTHVAQLRPRLRSFRQLLLALVFAFHGGTVGGVQFEGLLIGLESFRPVFLGGIDAAQQQVRTG